MDACAGDSQTRWVRVGGPDVKGVAGHRVSGGARVRLYSILPVFYPSDADPPPGGRVPQRQAWSAVLGKEVSEQVLSEQVPGDL
jgi:hypothetical protein